MIDSKGIEIKEGMVGFYSEMPHSNYADSLVYIYNVDGELFVGTCVGNWHNEYVAYEVPDERDIRLECYGKDILGNQTGVAKEITIIEGLTLEEATVKYANEHFPLGEET